MKLKIAKVTNRQVFHSVTPLVLEAALFGGTDPVKERKYLWNFYSKIATSSINYDYTWPH